MFKINAEPTFETKLTIVGQGREQVLNVTFRHKTGDEYAALLKGMADGSLMQEDAVLQLVEKWDADAPLSLESVKLLRQQQPGSDWAIITGYQDAFSVARKGN